ncbi:MAG: cbb3-type cytochrome oxidase subunit 3 [Granulosicoccus sp.]
MMSFQHADLVYFAKTYGLLYLMGISALIVAYVYWPTNKAKFDSEASKIIDDEDKPCL